MLYCNNRASSAKIKLQQLNERKATQKTFRFYLICKALTLLLWSNMVASLRERRIEGCTRAIFTALLGNETSYMPFHNCTLPLCFIPLILSVSVYLPFSFYGYRDPEKSFCCLQFLYVFVLFVVASLMTLTVDVEITCY